jgi:hypothetical protein
MIRLWVTTVGLVALLVQAGHAQRPAPSGNFVGRSSEPERTQRDSDGEWLTRAADGAGRGRTEPDAVGNRRVAFQDRCLQPLGHHASNNL